MLELGCRTNIDVVAERIDLAGLTVIDVGCGGMTFSRQLAEHGASVLAVDPDPIQAEKNRAAVDNRIQFFETGADHLPADDASVDGVFFAYSLHHVPAAIYPALFTEVCRVIKREGFLYVIEPAGGPLNDVMMLFHDEEQVRSDAQVALNEIAAANFETVEQLTYHSFREFESFEDFANQFSSKSFNSSYTAEQVYADQVRDRFEALGSPGYRFAAPKQVWWGRRLVAE